MKITHFKSLQKENTFNVPSVCSRLIDITSIADLDWLSRHEFLRDVDVIGEGSNIILPEYYPRTLIRSALRGIDVEPGSRQVRIAVASGENWNQMVRYCVSMGFYGLENLVDIPGSVGAAPIQNIGAYGVEAGDLIEAVHWYSFEKKRVEILDHTECQFGYRDSIFKAKLRRKGLITRVDFILSKERENCNVAYKELNQFFKLDAKADITPENVMKAVSDTRSAKLPCYRTHPNAGSFFKNPVINTKHFEEIKARYPDLPFYKVENDYKIPAAWLIEQCKLKGFSLNGVTVSAKHPLIIINSSGANAEAIKELALYVIKQVKDKFSIRLEQEVNLLEPEYE